MALLPDEALPLPFLSDVTTSLVDRQTTGKWARHTEFSSDRSGAVVRLTQKFALGHRSWFPVHYHCTISLVGDRSGDVVFSTPDLARALGRTPFPASSAPVRRSVLERLALESIVPVLAPARFVPEQWASLTRRACREHLGDLGVDRDNAEALDMLMPRLLAGDCLDEDSQDLALALALFPNP